MSAKIRQEGVAQNPLKKPFGLKIYSLDYAKIRLIEQNKMSFQIGYLV